MKHCPECNKNYADPTLSFCLQDGAPLIFGSAVEEPATAILSGDPPSEAPTTTFNERTAAPSEYRSAPAASSNPVTGYKSILVLGVLAVAVIAISFFGYRYYLSASTKQIDSVAVLPFENGSGDADLDYLSDGLSESLIDKLLELPQLKVIARNSSFKFRGSGLDLQDVAKKLGVRAIVTGKVTRVGDNLNVRVEMIDAAENRQLWSDQFNRKTSDLISIQQEIAKTASDKLRLKLTGDQQQQIVKRETVNSQAFELLMQGRYVNAQGGTDNTKRAVDLFERAVAADPNYALAYAELSLKSYILAGSSAADPKVYMPKAESTARRALELDSNLAEAHLAISRIYVARWQWQEGEAERKRAIELEPNNAYAHDLYAQLLSILCRHDEAIAEARRAVDLDPLSTLITANLGYRLHFARRYDESIAEEKKVLASNPNLDYATNFLGYAYSGNGQFKEAIAAYLETIRLGDKSTSTQVFLGAAYAHAGERDKAQAILNQLRATTEYVSPAELAILYVALGDKEGAFALLEKAYGDHDLQMQFLKVDPEYDSVRDDPRFQDLVRRVGLPE
jgi:TolB-like protein/Flp pilus assembly protein TadD